MNKTIAILALMALSGIIKSQTGGRVKPADHELIINTWFESPRESHGDTITYRLTKHIHVPGVDDPKMLFNVLVFSAAPDFTVENWRWCPKSKFIFGGKWNVMTGNIIKLDFGTTQKCKCQLSILSIEKDKLQVIIKTTQN
jgi:hypothetical protein